MAVEVRDGKKVLVTPVSAEDLKDIHIGDIVYLTGDITTCRDVAHRRVVEEGREIPVDVKNAAILHAGPIIRPLGEEKYEMVSEDCAAVRIAAARRQLGGRPSGRLHGGRGRTQGAVCEHQGV